MSAGSDMQFDDDEHELRVFDDMFYRDVEAGWNANHLYCDDCLDDFVAEWPLAYSAREAELQCGGIGLDTFYSGSRMHQAFTKEDFRRLIVKLECPNCGAPLGANIWPYHLPFDVPKNFHGEMHEIGELAKKAPFLLLTHTLSAKVFDLVKRASKDAAAEVVSERLYRARALDPSVKENLECFDFPPPHVVAEGRYNHAGRPVLYMASSEGTCAAELRNRAALVASFRLTCEMKVLDLLKTDAFSGDDHNLISALSYSALVSAPENGVGWNRPAYVFTRFLADCATFAGFDAVRYPSTRLSGQDGTYNIVVLNRDLLLTTYAAGVSFALHQP
jgi:hypothetical protein